MTGSDTSKLCTASWYLGQGDLGGATVTSADASQSAPGAPGALMTSLARRSSTLSVTTPDRTHNKGSLGNASRVQLHLRGGGFRRGHGEFCRARV